MSVTAVPLRPIAKGSLMRLWVGVGAVALAAAGLAWAGQQGLAPSPSAFMADNGKEPGIVTTASGLQYKVIQAGDGASPQDSDVALVSYRGSLVDGTVFDESEQTAMPIDSVVPGFAEALKLMKKDSVLINAARGGVVDEAALADALHQGKLGGAALDVFEREPLDAAHGKRFEGLNNLILTPHVAGVTVESNVRVSDLIAVLVLGHLGNGKA